MSDSPVVEVTSLSKVYEPPPRWMRFLVRSPIKEPVVALKEVDLTLGGAEILAVVGPNGAGKTTLFRLIVGLTTPTSGVGTVLGLDLARPTPEARKLIGFTAADDRTLFLRQSVEQNLRFHGHLHGMASSTLEQRIDEVLEKVGLEGTRTRAGFALSAGMRARLQIARAILHHPRLLILDEPTGAVDPVAAYGVVELVRQIAREEGTAVLLSSHRLEEIEALGERVLLLDAGEVRFNGSLVDLRSEYDSDAASVVFNSEPAAVRAHEQAVATGSSLQPILQGTTVIVKPATCAGVFVASLGDAAADIVEITRTRTSLMELLSLVYARRDQR